MDFTTLFGLFYTKFRGEETPPGTTDPEWTIAVRNYNDALQRMENFDDTKWNFLWSTLRTTVGTGGITTLTTGTTSYACPNDMAEPGGQLSILDSNGNRTNYPVVNPYEVQALNQQSQAAYFTGDRNNGFTLHLNKAPTSTENGRSIDYNYYKKVSLLNPTTETGTSIIAGGDPAYYYLHMVAQRFLDNRNFPAYQVALRDSEEALKGMKLKNNSGTHYSAWTLLDTSGSGWGY
jgi:hypothetical protein